MEKRLVAALQDHVPGLLRLQRLPGQLLRQNPFSGNITPSRIPLWFSGNGRPCLPFPHIGNYRQPLQILDSCFWDADAETGDGKHYRYLNIPGVPPILISRDPAFIRAVAKESGDREGQFERDVILASGIAKGTGKDMLLYANGPQWRQQRKLAAPPLGKTSLFDPERFQEFEATFRNTIRARLEVLHRFLETSGPAVQLPLDEEIKPIMLELLACNFFGAEVSYDQIRQRYVPAMDRVIDRMVSDTVIKLGLPFRRLPVIVPGVAEAREDYRIFEELVDLVLAARPSGRGLWNRFKSDASDSALRSNLRLVLAGALEATTSSASWAISHLARNPVAQEKAFADVRAVHNYTPDHLENASYFNSVLNETLRLTPPLYFLPRRAPVTIRVDTAAGRHLVIPKGAYVVLDHWHANRHEDHWGVEASGYPADEFVPERWQWLAEHQRDSKDFLHFGFGHGPRVCPGKHLAELEVSLVVGAFVKLFRCSAVTPENPAVAGISTKPADGALVQLELREAATDSSDLAPATDPQLGCPRHK